MLPIFSQTVALWLRNTNYSEKERSCFTDIQKVANYTKVKLFQRKSVFEMLWGYTDPFLEFVILGMEQFQCPGPDGGITDFVQMQVRQIVQ